MDADVLDLIVLLILLIFFILLSFRLFWLIHTVGSILLRSKGSSLHIIWPFCGSPIHGTMKIGILLI